MSIPPTTSLALVRTLELKDPTTAAHTWRVVLYTRALAESFHADHGLINRLSFAAALHDVGKIDIPDAILLKPGKLTDAEFEVIKTHPVLGHERLLRMGEDDPLVLELVRHHHERLDGLGYPDGLTTQQIPLAALYFSVVDTFDALTSVRPYRQEIGHDAGIKAIDELLRNAGTRYAKESVEAFKKLFDAGDLDWIMEHFNDRCELPAPSDPEAIKLMTRQRR
ncbi:MAG: HD domain-containing protein [Phycisphaerales bacterium]|nr:HD domain-containing protein [Phycisphaerales bacterium]